MSREKFSLAVCQLRTETDYEETMSKAEAMLRDAIDKGLLDFSGPMEIFPRQRKSPGNTRRYAAG